MRIITGGILHETSTFAAGTTTLRDFEAGKGLLRGAMLLETFRGANFCPGGFLDGAERHGFELIPLLWTFATPSGLVERACYDTLKQEFLADLRRERDRGMDGVLLDLHGAMVVEGIEDADADLLAAVRATVGEGMPVMVTTDLHANHSAARLAACNAIIGYDTFPHVDMAERGREAADLIVRTIRGEIRPVSAIRKIPLIWSAEHQVTAHHPMDEVMQRVFEAERRPGMLAVTLATGFPWADVPNMGPSVIAIADGDPALAQRIADELGDWIWKQRERWYIKPLTVQEGLTAGQETGRYPILLADMADNTGGGAPGDSTFVLRTLVEQDVQDALLLYMVDPEVAQQAHTAGAGAQLSVAVGGKSDPRQGPPVPLEVEVVALSDGRFRYDGPMYSGTDGNLGVSAWLRHRGVNIVVVSVRMQPLDQAFARSLRIDCAAMKVIVVKSAAHFRSGFERLGGPIFNVNAPAMHSHDYTQLTYLRRPPVYPVELS
ncbi:MAG TPA: M81 family metallopeptidase [Chthonomonadaceae bacterium]|nr:M81 family metallopeptidase [Chthonomonadaceae bacterium]